MAEAIVTPGSTSTADLAGAETAKVALRSSKLTVTSPPSAFTTNRRAVDKDGPRAAKANAAADADITAPQATRLNHKPQFDAMSFPLRDY
jgi:hypothetical protein